MAVKLRARSYKNEEEGEEPVSPTSQSLCTSLFSLYIHIIFQFERPLEIPSFMKFVADSFVPKNPRFSCILEVDEGGVLVWRKTAVNIEDHFVVAELPHHEHQSNDYLVNEYMCNLCLKPLDSSRPLWEFHVLNCKTSRAEATLILKVHHAVGDGMSLMASLFTCATRADNFNLLPSFPAPKRPTFKPNEAGKRCFLSKYFVRLWYVIRVLWYTLTDVVSCVLRMRGWIKDSKLPNVGVTGMDSKTDIVFSSASFHLDDIRQIKKATGGTVNDVLTGIIFYGLQRYLQIFLSADEERTMQDMHENGFQLNESVRKQVENLRVTTLSMINIRTLAGLQNVEEMIRSNSQLLWGNHFGYLQLQIPLKTAKNPLEFVRRAKRIIDRNKMSLGIYVIGKILGLLARLKGPQVLANYVDKTSQNTTMLVSNVMGPTENIALNGNVINSLSFFVCCAPQLKPLSIYMLSYKQTITMQVVAHKAHIDADLLASLLQEGFKEFKEASIQLCG